MADRNAKVAYCFLQDFNGMFYRAKQSHDGTYIITKNAQPWPCTSPVNLLKVSLEFATNEKYNSQVRNISYSFDFIKDAAAILRQGYIINKGIEEKMFFTVVEWNGVRNLYELSYTGKIDFSQKTEDPKQEMFSASTIDDSAWGVLSQNDETQYAIDCSESNEKCIKVLFDGLTLKNNYTYQTVQAPIIDIDANVWHMIPFVLVNQDGDSSGILQKNQTGGTFSNTSSLDSTNSGFFFYTAYALTAINITGNYMFEWSRDIGGGDVGLIIAYYTSTGQKFTVFSNQPAFGGFPFLNPGALIPGHIYDIPYNFTINLSAGESIFFIQGMFDNAANHFTINPIVSNAIVSVKTRPQAVFAYGLRPLDLLQALVSKATNNRFSINSSFFVENDKDIAFAGDSLRGIPNAKIYSSFADFFVTFDAIYYMALRDINGALWMEKYIEVYRQDSTIFDIGNIIDYKSSPALENYYNEIVAGSPKQDYRHPSGRLEFNSENTFSAPILTVNKKLTIITKYRLGCYDITFLILDYKGQSTQDNSGDKSVYLAKITDESAMAVDDIETFENVTIDNSPLEPIIKTPLTNDVISNDKPVIRGIAPVGSNVNIYVDTVLDGNTTADSDGNWSYIIVTSLTPFVIGVTTGIHVIDATYTDLSAPVTTITVTIYDSFTTDTIITYPRAGDGLYNNKPLIKGTAQFGQNFDVLLDGVVIGNVTGDESCKWTLQSPVIPNGDHVLTAGGSFASFSVDTNVEFPLITYIGSELDGFTVINNLPLIKGVANPGTLVKIWLNYIPNITLGTVTADANGDWSYQVVPINYLDPLTGIPVIVAPIRNGLSVISTSLVNHTVGIIVTGFRLSRPAYSSITGVIDNTVFNTEYTSKRMIINHAPMLASMLAKQPMDSITFQTADKNGNLSTTLNGVTITENTNITVSSLGKPFEIYEKAKIRTKADKTFADLLYNFNKGGVIKGNFRGDDLYFMAKGSMKINNITSEVQDWELILSPLTSYFTLLNLYKQGITIKLNNNTMYHSSYNTLHVVKYNFQLPDKYNTKDIYEDWFNNRNDFWALNPDYIQKHNKNVIFKDQVITRGTADLRIDMCSCITGNMVISFDYDPVSPVPIAPPEVVKEAIIDLSSIPDGQYFGVIYAGDTPVGITERIQIKPKWLRTILIESSNSTNKTGAFFSTGFKTIICVEGIVNKWQPTLVDFVASEENGDTDILYAVNSKQRVIRFGTAYGLPDYLGAVKIPLAAAMDEFFVEGKHYTIDPNEKFAPSDSIPAHPLYYYNVTVELAENEEGVVINGDPVDGLDGVFLNIDGTAFGMPVGTIIGIDLANG